MGLKNIHETYEVPTTLIMIGQALEVQRGDHVPTETEEDMIIQGKLSHALIDLYILRFIYSYRFVLRCFTPCILHAGKHLLAGKQQHS